MYCLAFNIITFLVYRHVHNVPIPLYHSNISHFYEAIASYSLREMFHKYTKSIFFLCEFLGKLSLNCSSQNNIISLHFQELLFDVSYLFYSIRNIHFNNVSAKKLFVCSVVEIKIFLMLLICICKGNLSLLSHLLGVWGGREQLFKHSSLFPFKKP